MSIEDSILTSERDGILTVTINLAHRHNALGHDDWGHLADVFEEADRNKAVGVIVLTGAGDRSFCAGGYLADLSTFDADRARSMYRSSARLFTAIRRARQPVIAAVNGYAIGGGNELVIACDLAIASDTARFGQVGPKVGSTPVFGGNNLLALSIGEKRAKEVCFMCRQFTAAQALELGWINKVVPPSELTTEVESWCQELLDRSPAYLEATKVSSNTWWDMMQVAYSHGEQILMALAGSEQNLEGARAFMEKRKPEFRRFRKQSNSGQ